MKTFMLTHKLVPYLVLALSLLATTSATAAADSSTDDGHCHCDSYQHLVKFSVMGSQVTDISLRVLHPEQNPFAYTEADRQALRTAVLSNALIPAECKQYLISKNLLRLTIVASGPVAANGQLGSAGVPPYTYTNASVGTLLGGYQSLADAAVQGACGKLAANPTQAQMQSYTTCVQTKGLAALKQFQKQFGSQTTQQILAANAQQFPSITAGQISVLKIYNTLIASSDANWAGNYLAGLKKTLSTDQKLLLGQLLMSFANNPTYDNARNNAGAWAKGVVSGNQILSAEEQNTLVGGSGPNQIAALLKYAGVCRDDHTLVAMLEQKLGIPHSMTTSFAQMDGGYHVTYIGQDPDHPLVAHQINWDARHDTIGGDSRSLNQGPSDISTNYRLSLPNGRMVGDVQSQSGMFLAKTLGFDANDPLSRDYGRMIAGEYSLGQNGGTNLHLGTGWDGMGAQYTFAGVTQSWDQSGHWPGRAGLSIGTMAHGGPGYDMAGGDPETYISSPGKPNTPNPTFNLDYLYAQIEQKYVSSDLKITPSLRMRFETSIGLNAMVARAREGGSTGDFSVNPGAISGQGDGHVTNQLVFNQGNPGDATQGTYKVGVRWTGGVADIRNNYLWQVPIPVLDAIYASADFRHKLGQTHDGQLMLVAAAQLAVNEMSARGRAEAGLASDRFACTVGAEGRITNSSATYEDSSARQGYIGCKWVPNRHVEVNAAALVPLEKGTPQGVMATGSTLVRF
jgi:hypothetical protein